MHGKSHSLGKYADIPYDFTAKLSLQKDEIIEDMNEITWG